MEKKQSGEVTISLTFREETKTSLHFSLDTIKYIELGRR